MTAINYKETIRSALRDLWNSDRSLLDTNASERAICHRLAIYIEMRINDAGVKLNVDCEYNRMGSSVPKALFGIKGTKIPKGKSVHPDIIIHSRTNETENILVLEVKKSSSKNIDKFDEKKIDGYVDELRYRNGYCVLIKVGAACKRSNCDNYYIFSHVRHSKPNASLNS